MKNRFKLFKAVKIVVAVIFFFLLFGFGTMHLWNWLIPALFSGPIISFWQAIGLIVLSKILFGGFHSRGGRCGGRHSMRNHWKRKFEERMASMTDEEKEKFRSSCAHKFQ
ncbi:MAG: hypothetical protein WCP52_11290 [Bacteroidota bacterium]